MNSKERVRASIEHRTPDRVPIDFGSTAVTGMHVSVVAALREQYGLPRHPVKVIEPYQMLGEIEPDLLDRAGIDTVPLPGSKNLFGFRNEHWKEFRTPWGQVVLVPGQFNTRPAPQGGIWLYPSGDMTVPPSGRMPASGYFFDTIIRQEPIDEDHLNPEDNLEEFKPLSADDAAWYREQAALLKGSSRAVVGGPGGTAFGDIALVPAPFLKHPKGIRDIEEWYVSIAARKSYVRAVFEQQCAMALRNLAAFHDIVGETLDVLFVCGTDFGTQQSSFCSVRTFEEMYLPWYRQVNDWVHRHTHWKTFKHSCGAVEPFIGRFIDCGFDILNPVQCSAAGMDPVKLNDKYGDRITFWGGGADTQQTLPFGTPAQVRDEVLRRCEIFARKGGFVFNVIHNVQARTPIANLAAALDAVQEFQGSAARR
ncbi:MAG TPA: uroporphyrinogen decarboxylase family protein [Planctomycetota bacterium]|nr:uroporphyrinogen decarboxylase family protein [Planctomycetota bacterium]